MANVKITDLTAIAGVDLASNDVLPIVDINVDQTKKVSISDLQVGISDANDFVTYTRLQANIDLVQDNVASVDTTTASATETRLNANLDVVQSNVTAQNSYITTNYTTLLLTDSVQDNVASAESNIIALTTNVNTVQSNVTAVETRRSDNTFFTYNTDSNVVINTANVEPSQNNLFSLGAPDKVWKDVYIGPGTLQIGAVSISALGEEGISITGASGEQANVTTPSQGGVANVSAELEGLQSRLSTNVTTFTNEDTALQTRIAANTLVAASNDFATYTRLQANIDLVQDNVASVTVGTAADTETRLNANLDIVQDNVVAAEANVVLVRSNVDSLGSYANTTFSTVANAAALASEIATLSTVDTATGTETRLNANLDVTNDNVSSLTTTVDNFGTSSNSNAAALASGIVASEARVNANLDITNDNVAAIIDGTTQFTGDVTMQQALTVSGNLYVVGAQVDLGISSAQIDDATLLLAANTPADAQLAADAGIVINRGQDANVFFGFASYGDHIDFIFTDAPADNVNHYAIAYIDVHANSFGAEGTHDPTFTAVHHADRPTTGFYFPTNQIVGVIGGAYKANITASGLEAVAVYSDGVELQANDSATLFSAYANDFATYTLINANVDVVQDNVATLTTTVDNFGTSSNANAVALAAEDVALQSRLSTNVTAFSNEDTALQARITANAATAASNDYITYTRLNANVDVVQDNVAQNATDITAVETRRTANIAGAVSTITTGDLTASRALVSDGSGKVAVSAVTSTELGYLDGVTSAIQTQLDSKSSTSNAASLASEDAALQARITANAATAASNDFITYTRLNANIDVVSSNAAAVETRRAANIAGAVSTITTGNLTASRALVSDGSGKVAVSAVTSTELGYLDGVSSDIQNQLNSKLDSTSYTASDVLTKIKTVDGSGSGLDADLLDGQSSAYYAVESTRSTNAAALAAGIATKLNSSSYTASDVLTKIKTVDGSGSGLDADLLDGQSSAYYAVESTRSSNAAELAAAIAGVSGAGAFPTGDYGLLDSANAATDAFGSVTAGLTTFDMLTDPSGSLSTEDLGALT
jgi:hypothetical protein